MKYSIQPRYSESFRAGTKAVNDVCKILAQSGYEPFYVSYPSIYGNKITRNIKLLGDFYRLYKTIKPEDTVLIQWPQGFRNLWIFYWVIKKKCNHLQLLIHDIDILRGKHKNAKWTMRFLKMADKIIAHSQTMKDWLVDKGFDSDKIEILTAFDYLTDDKVTDNRKKTKEVVFAGNLEKSEFLQKILETDLGLTINCYGKKIDNLSKGLNYKCAFRSENVSALEGSWGLVWDGDSLDTCNGPMGEYQRYNSPHKLSLYIVAHLPVIVWKEAAMAQYVKEKGIGICVSSLREISGIIDELKENDYKTMIENIKRESDMLRSGAHLKACLK